MLRLFDRLLFIFGEALMALRRNMAMSFAAISTVALSLAVLGAIGSGYFALDRYAKRLPGRFEMRIFLKDDATKAELSQFAVAARSLQGVRTATLIPKELAWKRFAQQNPLITKGLDNPFPDAFKIVLSDLGQSDRVARRLRERPEVREGGVHYFRDEERYVADGLRLLRWAGSTIGALLLLTAGVLIFNAIRLALLSRRLEVRVMQLVGASPGVVYSPFLIEGALQGALGGVLAALLLQSAHIVLSNVLRAYPTLPTLPSYPWPIVMGALSAIGAIYGLALSALALVRLSVKTRFG